MTTQPPPSPGLFEYVCLLLNGEVRLPRAPRKEPLSRDIALFGDSGMKRRILIGNYLRLPKVRRHYERKAVRESAAALARLLRYLALEDAAVRRVTPRELPGAWGQWRAPSAAVLEAQLRKLMEHVSPLAQSLGDISREAAQRFQSALSERPRALSDALLRVHAAAWLQLSQRSRKRMVPCAACPRFFVARTATATTCSPACRQRLYRASQDEEGSRRLRKNAAEYKKAERQRKARQEHEAQASSHESPGAHAVAMPSRTSRTSPPRR